MKNIYIRHLKILFLGGLLFFVQLIAANPNQNSPSLPDAENIAVPINAQDQVALMALYNWTDGPHWKNKTGWSNPVSSNWFGVTVDANGRVIEINLVSNELNGTIPAQICDLSELRLLNLHGNRYLSGSIPDEIGNLKKLEELYLSDNLMSGKPIWAEVYLCQSVI